MAETRRDVGLLGSADMAIVSRAAAAAIFAGLTVSSACLGASRQSLLAVVQDGKYGFIDHAGRMAIPPQFAWAEDFWQGLGTVYVCGDYAFIDRSGALVPARYPPQRRLEPLKEGQKVGFVDDRGRFRIKPTFDEAWPFRQGLAAVRRGEKWGFVDTGGRLIIPLHFEFGGYFREGVATVGLGETTVLIDRTGHVLASGFKSLSGVVSHARVPAMKDEKGGYLDLQGRIAIPLDYDWVTTFSNGLAAVKKGDKWGYIDPGGRVVIPFMFDEADQFGSGLAPVRMGDRTGFINLSGAFAFELPFREAPGGFVTGDDDGEGSADSDVSRFWTADDRFGYVNTSGRVIWGPAEQGPTHAPLFGWSDEKRPKAAEAFPRP